MKKDCYNCKYRDLPIIEFPCMECSHKSRWEEWKDENYYPTTEDIIIEELEDIMAEIINNRDEWLKGQDPEWSAYDNCSVIIDKHISKWKGFDYERK